MWFKQIPSFSKKFRVIVFDNRGVGRTDKPDEVYSIEMMADDAAGLLNSLNIKSAHVLGVSMGGFIAHELALRCPDSVRNLILVCTSSGFKNKALRNFETWRDVMDLWGFDSKSYGTGNTQFPPHYINLSEEDILCKGISETRALQNLILNKNEID